MITGETERGKFIIATPTKCGTTTMEALAKRHMRNAGADADEFRIMDWDSPRRQHRMALPPVVESESNNEWAGEQSGELEWGAATRYLFVRNPYTRYMSMYTYLSAPQNYSQWGAREIQGVEWAGEGDTPFRKSPKMNFEEFLIWLSDKRYKFNRKSHRTKRGDLTKGRAYRSPWVWTDSLLFSLDALASQPGPSDVVTLLRLEQVWEDLAALKETWGIDSLQLGGLHSNRSTAYGEEGADPGSADFWGGIKHGEGVFVNRVFKPLVAGRSYRSGCGCGACRIGVVSEADELGYLG